MAVEKRQAKYNAAHIKRIPLDVQIELYSQIKAAAEASGVGVNTYIKQAIAEKMNKEG